jgi:colanic acid/amylovoran biosynthesis glycosyltransferase
LVVNYKKFKSLRKTTAFKLLLHDIPVWTTTNLDYLHFAFGNLAFGRENYAEVMGCKMSVSFRGSDINVYPKWHNLSYRLILNKCHKVQCNSQALKSEVSKHNDNVESKIAVINPGLQPEFIITVEEIELLQQKRLKNYATIFISVGRLHWIKGYEHVFKALGILKRKGFNFEYYLIGQGPEEEKLVFLSHFYEIQENVKFLGLQKPSEIRTFLESANVFIQTSWAEGFSNSALEAQALGLPVIVTPISGMNELVLHEKTGHITQSHSSEDILCGIEWYLNLTSDEKNDLAINAKQRVRDNFSMELLSKKWQSFFS